MLITRPTADSGLHDRQQRADSAEDVHQSFEEPVHGASSLAQPLEAARNERRHAVADRFEVARLAQAVREPVDASVCDSDSVSAPERK
jgi:hypothetical protein